MALGGLAHRALEDEHLVGEPQRLAVAEVDLHLPGPALVVERVDVERLGLAMVVELLEEEGSNSLTASMPNSWRPASRRPEAPMGGLSG